MPETIQWCTGSIRHSRTNQRSKRASLHKNKTPGSENMYQFKGLQALEAIYINPPWICREPFVVGSSPATNDAEHDGGPESLRSLVKRL
ncbi:hypothetical protein PoB_007225800 [Plakobranchus ocellatus]|uniref:Uncharacterized protein n=1 Tax=Plakobranchus ocellatus TaxID=259542 RepID=A0AAV4DN58_9GAST|nr:hypothetical protein PoB_007225800 [Plakobranchus ocellatus]